MVNCAESISLGIFLHCLKTTFMKYFYFNQLLVNLSCIQMFDLNFFRRCKNEFYTNVNVDFLLDITLVPHFSSQLDPRTPATGRPMTMSGTGTLFILFAY